MEIEIFKEKHVIEPERKNGILCLEHFSCLQVVARETLTAEQRSSTATVTVNLRDVNDNTPKFTQREYTAFVREDRGIGYFVKTITVSTWALKIKS